MNYYVYTYHEPAPSTRIFYVGKGHGAGRTTSAETLAKMSAAQKGKKLTEEHKAKIKATLAARKSRSM